MELLETAVSRGLTGPLQRLAGLGVACYVAAAAHPLPDSIAWLITGPRHPAPGVTVSHDFEVFHWSVFPLFDGAQSDASPIYLPVMGFCVVCSAMDRGDWKFVTLFGAVSTFALYVIEDLAGDWDGVMKNLVLLVAASICPLWNHWMSRR